MTYQIDALVTLFDNCRMVLCYPAGDGDLLLALRARGIPAVSLDPDQRRAQACQDSQLRVWQADWKVIRAQTSKFDGIHVDLDRLSTAENADFNALVHTFGCGLLPGGHIAMTGSRDTDDLVVQLSEEFTVVHTTAHVTILQRTRADAEPDSGMIIGPSADAFVGCAHVLEIGSGHGHFLDALKLRDIECSGIESDPEMAKLCREQGHRVASCPLSAQGDDQDAYDGIYAGNSLDSLTPQALAQVIRHCQYMLRDEGRLLLRIGVTAHDLALVEAQVTAQGFTIQRSITIPGNTHDHLITAVLDKPTETSEAPLAHSLEICTSALSINQPLQDLYDLERFERRVNSQGGEDGVLDAIFSHIGTTNRFYVEFGCGDGVQCNTANLHRQGWQGLLMDGMAKPAAEDVVIHKEWISRENINQLFEKHGVPSSFDLLSIDIDGNDYWVLDAITYRPRVIVAEYNANLGPTSSVAMPYDSASLWDGSDYYGASLQALVTLLLPKNYRLVYCNQAGVNAFFVDAEYLQDTAPKSVSSIFRAPNYWYRGYRQVPDLAKVMIQV